MVWDQNLTGKALLIASTECKYLRVMAGPGTGKTFAMKRRVARLLEERNDPESMLVVTFTRIAAASLVKELRELGSSRRASIRAIRTPGRASAGPCPRRGFQNGAGRHTERRV